MLSLINLAAHLTIRTPSSSMPLYLSLYHLSFMMLLVILRKQTTSLHQQISVKITCSLPYLSIILDFIHHVRDILSSTSEISFRYCCSSPRPSSEFSYHLHILRKHQPSSDVLDDRVPNQLCCIILLLWNIVAHSRTHDGNLCDKLHQKQANLYTQPYML